MRPSIGVLIVDDSAVVRKIVSEALTTEGDIVVAGVAPNGRIALERLELLRPDIVLLDLEMPEMDGLATLKVLRERFRDLPVVVFSTMTERGAAVTLDALAAGANDYVCKPSGAANLQASMRVVRGALLEKIRVLVARARDAREVRVSQSAPRPLPPPPPLPEPSNAPIAAVAIGISAGGPAALSAVVPQIPADIGVPIVLVQHMPATFTALLAQRLGAASRIRVLEATHRGRLEAGTLYVAPGDRHLTLGASGTSVLTLLDSGPLENGCRPAVDPLFRSAAQVYGTGLLAVVMTGMGTDGTLGATEVRRSGGHVWAQDQATSTIWGMAGSVVRAGLAERIFRLDDLAGDMARLVRKHRPAEALVGGRGRA
ncbi:MAG TPA: chemotaxis-specific protein-glutamate methyltransferase CheB [Polyangiaceae bacterium]|nr:chemotaxis-specific protein-glutamate methyltransferase CheB [Polyangiaceae bacterium]